MKIAQKSWPFGILILFLAFGLPMIDKYLKKEVQKDVIEIQIEKEVPRV